MAKTGIKIYMLAALAAVLPVSQALVAQAATPAAPAIADSPCDVDYYKSLESRAWLEAQREITQNQNLIYKPDSVLEYTCFDQFAGVTANMQSWQGFSETSRWGAVITPLTTEVDNAMNGLVGPSLFSYLNINFNNADPNATPPRPDRYMAGRGEAARTLSPTITAGAYNCAEMNKVWETAKCSNFQSLEQDGFFTFEQHSQGDKRLLPRACTNPNAQWQLHIQASGLKPDTAPAWPFDKVEVYYDKLKPENCSASSPLATGVTVKTSTPESSGLPPTWAEKICIIPGCYFDPAAGQCTATGG